jgi:nitrogen fixation NifU-like protein
MDELYQQNILEHFKHPHHKGALALYDTKTDGVNPSCGDQFVLYLKFADDTVFAAGFEGEGCAISTASMSMLLDHSIGKTKSELRQLSAQDVHDLLGIPIGPQREKCASLSLSTLHSALSE